MIPKRIIHIYCAPKGQPDELPLVCRAALVNSKAVHPDFEHVLFGKAEMEDFLTREFPEYRSVMDSFPYPIQRFDFFRYLAVYRLGGFYLDLDVFLAKSLAPLLDQKCVFPFEELTISDYLRTHHNMDWEMANYGFGARPGDPFIAAVIANCVRGHKSPSWAAEMLEGIPSWARRQFVVPVSTGPGMVSRTFAENPELSREVTVVFPSDVCAMPTWHRFGDFGVHLMQASWRKRSSFIRTRLTRLWETRTRRRQMTDSLRRGPRREGAWKEYPRVTAASTLA